MSRPTGTTFIPNGTIPPGGSVKDTAVLLIGTALEWDLPADSVFATNKGFLVSDDLAVVLAGEGILPYDEGMSPINNGVETSPVIPEIVSGNETVPEDETVEDETYDPADYTVESVKADITATDDFEFAQGVLDAEEAGKNRATLTSWIQDFLTAREGTESSNGESVDVANETPEEE
jgi:hypothetical protein